MTRSHFFWAITALLAALPAAGAEAVLAPRADHRPTFKPTPAEVQRLKQALEPLHRKYDPKERMLLDPFSSPGYHTTLKGGQVHSTRAAFNYAVALLDTGEEAYRQRAEEILLRVIALQDQDPASKTYGIWSWFLEEPLARMSPPDWNWADFCGTALLQVALDHRHRLAPETARAVDAAIQHAARSIKKRNVGPGYTNIAIMGAYVTLVAGELYDWAEMREYGQARWRQFYEHTKKHGAFNEYNSPTYTIVALEELGRMRQHVRDAEMRRLTEEIYRLAWEEIALHFHAPTRQWAGPHSRSYSTLLRGGTLALLQRATEGRVNFGNDAPSLNEIRLPLPCPPDLEKHFTQPPAPRELRKQFIAGSPPVVGTTWMQPEFTLGSVNRGDLWNQRRSLVAYWGDAKQPAYLHLRFLHDGYDFSAAQFFSVQQKARVLAGIAFATDGGDTHVSLDRLKNATVTAKDLRLRFEFGGAAGKNIELVLMDVLGSYDIQRGGLTWRLQTVHASFDREPPHWAVGNEPEKAWVDLVLYSGEAKSFNLAEISQAAIAFTLEANPTGKTKPATSRVENGTLKSEWDNLSLAFPARPARVGDLQRAYRGEVR